MADDGCRGYGWGWEAGYCFGQLFLACAGYAGGGRLQKGAPVPGIEESIKIKLYDRISLLADLCLVIGGFCGADRHFREGGVKRRQFRSGYGDPDGGGVVDNVGDCAVPGECAGDTRADTQQLAVPCVVGGGDGTIVVVLLSGAAAREGVGGECD